MIFQFTFRSLDPYLHECLDGLPGIVTVYRLDFPGIDAYGSGGYLIGATGEANSEAEWKAKCLLAICRAIAIKRRIDWMLEGLDMKGI